MFNNNWISKLNEEYLGGDRCGGRVGGQPGPCGQYGGEVHQGRDHQQL